MHYTVHADDCGLGKGITEDILQCADAGALHGTSVMTGGTYAREALHALADRPGIAARVHLNLLEGLPTAPGVRELTGTDGLFAHSMGSLLCALHTLPPRRKKRLKSAIRTEFEAQICFFRTHMPDRPVTLDGHLHVHAIPALQDVLRDIIREYAVTWVRLPWEVRHMPPLPLKHLPACLLRRELLAFWSGSLRRLLDTLDVAHNSVLAGVCVSGMLTPQRLQKSLLAAGRKGIPDAEVEIMTHPGGVAADEDTRHMKQAYLPFYTSPDRAAEKNMLLSRGCGGMECALQEARWR